MRKLTTLLTTIILAGGLVGCGSAPAKESAPEITPSQPTLGQEVEKEEEVTETTEEKESETVVYEDNDVKVTFIGVTKDIVGLNVNFLIENNRAENLMFSTKNLSVNGYMVTAGMYETVAAGKKAKGSIILWGQDVEDIGGKIDDVEFILRVYDNDDIFNGFEVESDIITIAQ